MTAQITAFPESARGFNGLEKVLEKSGILSRLSSDFLVRTSNKLIDDAVNTVKREWSLFHPADEFDVIPAFTGYGRVPYKEIDGSSGFYANVEYVPPDRKTKRNAQIRVRIPLQEGVGGLESLESAELRKIAQSLNSKGYT